VAQAGWRNRSVRVEADRPRSDRAAEEPNDAIGMVGALAHRVRRRPAARVPAAGGSWRTTERLDRDRTRRAPSGEVFAISRPWRAWGGDDRASAQTACPDRADGKAQGSVAPREQIDRLSKRANA
jgi:hypothetical protein